MDNVNSSDILCSIDNGMLKIMLNRPKNKNAITIAVSNISFESWNIIQYYIIVQM